MIAQLFVLVGACATLAPLLVVVDGFSSYVKVVKRTFRTAAHSGARGRPRLHSWPGLVFGQVVKRSVKRHLVGIERRMLRGAEAGLAQLIEQTQGCGVLNTSYIERLNGTFRQRLASLARRSRNLVRSEATMVGGMYLIGTVYNFCTQHESLSSKGRQRTPAMAAGITDHCWSVEELLWHKVAPPRWQPPKLRGRRSKALQHLVERWVS